MGITEVKSPASSGSRGKVGSGQPRTFPSRTTPGRRADQTHQSSQSPPKARVSLGGEGEPAEVHITGPKELPDKRPQERQSPEE